MSLDTVPSDERPREKLKKYGPSALTETELLALIIRTGHAKENVLTLSANLLKKCNLKKLSRTNLSTLQKSLGIGETKASQIVACFELSRRLSRFKQHAIQVKQARDIVNLLMHEMRALSKEHLKVVLLNAKKRILAIETVFIGSLSESVINPKEIFQRALEENAAALILVHNHPSGDPTPSTADIESTAQIAHAGEIMDIHVLDHIIIGDNVHVSLREKGLIPVVQVLHEPANLAA